MNNYPIYQISLINKNVSKANIHFYESPTIPNGGDVILIDDSTYFEVKNRIFSGKSNNLSVVLDGKLVFAR